MHRVLYICKKRFKSYLKNIIYCSPTRSDILDLIQRLKPVRTEYDLIRLGGQGDGGYLLPKDLIDIGACFSPGVGNTMKFEVDCADLGMKIFMADASVDHPLKADSRFNFIKKYLGNRDEGEIMKLETWIKNSKVEDNSADLLLQMDIEGHEYETLMATPVEVLKRFRIIIIEFHELQNLWQKEYFRYAKKSILKLTKNHLCVHIHPNNSNKIKEVEGIKFPPVAEFTFIRKDRVKVIEKIKQLPHPLDENNLEFEPVILPKLWYS